MSTSLAGGRKTRGVHDAAIDMLNIEMFVIVCHCLSHSIPGTELQAFLIICTQIYFQNMDETRTRILHVT